MCIKFVVIAFHKDNYKITELLRKRSSVCQERGISSPREQQQLTQRGAASPKSNKQGFKSCYACSDKINTRSQIAKPHIFITNPQTKTPNPMGWICLGHGVLCVPRMYTYGDLKSCTIKKNVTNTFIW